VGVNFPLYRRNHIFLFRKIKQNNILSEFFRVGSVLSYAEKDEWLFTARSLFTAVLHWNFFFSTNGQLFFSLLSEISVEFTESLELNLVMSECSGVTSVGVMIAFHHLSGLLSSFFWRNFARSSRHRRSLPSFLLWEKSKSWSCSHCHNIWFLNVLIVTKLATKSRPV